MQRSRRIDVESGERQHRRRAQAGGGQRGAEDQAQHLAILRLSKLPGAVGAPGAARPTTERPVELGVEGPLTGQGLSAPCADTRDA